MRGKIVSSTLAFGLLSSVSACEDLSTLFDNGKTSGQLRAFYVDREYQGGSENSTHRNAFAIGGHLKFETKEFRGLRFATSFYTTNNVNFLNYKGGINTPEHDPSLSGTDGRSYSILGEGYVDINFASLGTKTTAKLGYQRYDTPMIGSDDARSLPNTFHDI